MASQSWERRNAHARALGFRNYYDYRVHDFGRSPSRLGGEALRAARGHAGAADLERLLRTGKVAVLSQEPVGDRDAKGRYREVRVAVQMTDGSQRRFTLKGHSLTPDGMRPLQAAVADAGADIYTNPSLDVLFLFDRDELDEELDWTDFEDELEDELE